MVTPPSTISAPAETIELRRHADARRRIKRDHTRNTQAGKHQLVKKPAAKADYILVGWSERCPTSWFRGPAAPLHLDFAQIPSENSINNLRSNGLWKPTTTKDRQQGRSR